MAQSFDMQKIDSIQPCGDHSVDDNQESSRFLPDGDPSALKEYDQTEESYQCCHVSYYFLQKSLLITFISTHLW